MTKLLQPPWRIRFLVKTDSPTDIQIGQDSEDVFVDDLAGGSLLPLVSFDLSTLNSDWHGRAHFVYGPSNCEMSAFRRVEEGTKLEYIGSVFYGSDSYELPDSFIDDDLVEEGGDIKPAYAELIEVELPELDLDADRYAIGDQIRSAIKPINAKRRDAGHRSIRNEMGLLDPANTLGGPPLWLQSAPILKTPSGNRDLYFLGQIFTLHIGDLADFIIYSFYCPEEDVIVTSMQHT